MAKKPIAVTSSTQAREIKDPFDRLFRLSMQEKKLAVELLRTYLPPELVQKIDFSTLTLLNGSTLLKNLRITHSDCVYGCTIQGQDAYIIVACEHQSDDDELMAFRVLKYVVGLMDNYSRQNANKKLPIILPVVIYHGKRSPYPHSIEIWDCFENPELAKQWVLKPFQLIDLTVMSDKEIQQHNLFSAMELVFKHAWEREALDWIKQQLIHSDKLAIIYSDVDSEYAEDFIKCLAEITGHNRPREEGLQLLKLCAEALPTIGEEIMTFAQQFRQEGLQQGRHDKAFEIAKNMLAEGADFQFVKRVTKLSDEEINRLRVH
ncbi:MAG: Rpn family recombination-promoting nuclease/putative transposase [Candidatus Symbiodolus clandestinus]